ASPKAALPEPPLNVVHRYILRTSTAVQGDNGKPLSPVSFDGFLHPAAPSGLRGCCSPLRRDRKAAPGTGQRICGAIVYPDYFTFWFSGLFGQVSYPYEPLPLAFLGPFVSHYIMMARFLGRVIKSIAINMNVPFTINIMNGSVDHDSLRQGDTIQTIFINLFCLPINRTFYVTLAIRTPPIKRLTSLITF
ncbi:TPA: hypothetical protein ACGEY7_004786, partial [Salmonella enterica]